MRRRRHLVLAAFLFASSCVSGPPAPSSSATPEVRGRARAVLLSFDGLGAERLTRLLDQPGALPAGGFRAIADRGLYASGSVPPSPALTAVSHVTHVTGTLPAGHGIVSNWMLDRSKPFGTTISGFDAPIRAETLWQAARRQGKRTGVMLYPGADGKASERTADFGMVFQNDAIAPPKLHKLASAAWEPVAPQPPGTFSPARRATLTFGKTPHSVGLTALDGSDDGRVNYDRVRVEAPDGRVSEVRPGEWFATEVTSEAARTGAWSKVLVIAPDLSLAEIYLGALHYTLAYPSDFRETLDAQVGFWPGTPDEFTFGAGSGRQEVFLEQAERLADFITRSQVLALLRTDWDLMLMYNPVADETGHEFLLADARQEGFTPERARQLQSVVDRSYAIADRCLRTIDRALAAGDSIFVTADHGMTPVWTEIYANEMMREAGIVQLDTAGKISEDSSAVAVTSGGIAHVYVNPSADRAAVLPAVERLLRKLRVEGESPWDEIVRREAAGPLGLDAPESGDLVAFVKPGFLVSHHVRPGKGVVGKADDLGAHGYLNRYPQLHAAFLAGGPGIPISRVGRINSWEIAAAVAKALGIEPPAQAISATAGR